MPDQRGFAGSDRPQDVDDYRADKLVDDIFALADALGHRPLRPGRPRLGRRDRWPAALRSDPRLTRLAIVNAPHPVVFQKSLIEDADQRAASQYINAFRTPGFEKAIEAMGWEDFFDKSFAGHVDLAMISRGGTRALYRRLVAARRVHARCSTGTAPRRWSCRRRASKCRPGLGARAFPKVKVPTLVIWGMKDKALLPLQLEGLDAAGRRPDDRRASPMPAISCRGRRREAVAAALKPFLAERAGHRPGACQQPVPVPAPPPGSPPSRRSTSRRWRARRSPACSTNSTSIGSARPSRTTTYAEAEVDFFDDLVSGADARREEIDALIVAAPGRRLEPRAARPADAGDPARRRL